MREIKFRGKRRSDAKWIYGYYVYTNDIHRIIYEDHEGFYCEDEVIPETVGQYTGLLDRKGRGIYDGDIVKTVKPGEYIPNRDSGGGIIDYDVKEPEERVCYIEFFRATFATKEINKNGTYYAPLDWIIDDEFVEVVGNIYKNIDLLPE